MAILSPAALAIQRGGSTVNQIAAALGVSAPAVSAYFSSRARPHPRLIDVVRALCDDETAREVASALGIEGDSDD